MKYKYIIILIIFNLAFSQYEYTLENMNPNSPTFSLNVWYPNYSDHITLHYFATQG